VVSLCLWFIWLIDILKLENCIVKNVRC